MKKNTIVKRAKIGIYKTVFKGTFFRITQAPVMLPSGVKKIFEKVVIPPGVTILAIDNRKNLLLIREYRHNYKKHVWRLPNGKIDPSEKPLVAAHRELREETGWRAKRMQLYHLTDVGLYMDWKRYAFLGQDLVISPLPKDEDEDIIVVPTPIKKAFAMVKSGEIDNVQFAYYIMTLYWKLTKK